VLVVEDELPVASTLHDMLAQLGYGVKMAVTGEEALTLAPIYQPDVVLLDVNLPGLTGDKVLERLHRSQPALAVIMVTGNGDPELARRTLAHGAFDYIAKPFKMARLEHVLEAAMTFTPDPGQPPR
jgi:two-component system C4-dicarboxylate transport response regulator DctD